MAIRDTRDRGLASHGALGAGRTRVPGSAVLLERLATPWNDHDRPGDARYEQLTTLQNHPTCIGQSCTFVQWSGTAADSSYASPVNGTIVAWRIASGSAGNPVKLRVLRPAGGGKYSAVASSATETTSGSAANPDQFSARIPIRAGDLIGLDNRNSALIFKTGVLGAFPEFWTPALSDGGSPSAPSPPVGTTSNGYQLQIDAYVEPAPTTTSTATTTTASTTTATVSTTTATTTATTPTTDTSLTVGEARVSAVWKASRLTGKVRFTVTVHGASRLNAVLQAPGHGRVWAGRNYETNRAGMFQETLRLPPQTPPGSYVLRVRATTGTSKQAERDHTLVLEAPPEGIVDSAAISLEKNGEAVSTAHAPEKELWVRFHFSSLPENAREVRIVWRTPSFRLVGAVVKRATATTDSFIRSTVPLAPGRWYAIVSVDGTVVKRVNVRVA